MKRIFINMLIVSVLANSAIPVVNVMAAEKNAAVTTASQESKEVKYTPVLEENINKVFNGSTDYVDLNNKLSYVKELNSGTFAIKFKTNASKITQTLFSISDSKAANNYFEVKLINGELRLETFENGKNVMSYSTENKKLADNNWHTAVISGGDLGAVLYIDGEKIYQFSEDKHKDIFISAVKNPDKMEIGRQVINNKSSNYFNGEIKYVEIYSEQFSHDYSLKYSSNGYRENAKVQGYESYLKYNPIWQHNKKETFNEANKLVNVTDDLKTVEDLDAGTVAIKFKANTKNQTQTLFSISDKDDAESYFEVKLTNKGEVRVEIFEESLGKTKKERNAMSYYTPNKNFGDNEWHTVVVTSGELGTFLYIDGERLVEFPQHKNKLISLVEDADAMNIGGIVKSGNPGNYFNGEIEYVEVYDEQFSHEYATKYSLNDYRSILNIIHGEKSNTIVFTGDSITHGVLFTDGYRSYSEHLRERLKGESINGKIKSESFVINTGVANGDTRHILADYNSWVGTYNADIVFITFGMNDCLTIPLETYKANLKTLVEKVRDQGGIPIIQAINTTIDANRAGKFPKFMQGAREVAKELDVFLIDHTKYWSDLGTTVTNAWLKDTVHPNAKGHLELTNLILRELKLDTEDSYTKKLVYPLQGNGTAKPVLNTITRTYPEYSSVTGKTPVVSYKVNRELYGSDFIDKSYDLNKVKSLSKGSIVTRFNLTSADPAQTILSLSDSSHASKEVAIGVSTNGSIFFNRRTDKGDFSFITKENGYNDGKWHTLVMNVDESGVNVYVDGKKIHTVKDTAFFSALTSPTNLSIGKNVHNTGDEWFYTGAVSYIDVYNNALSDEEIKSISSKIDSGSDFTAIRNKALQSGTVNTWALVGDNSTTGSGDTYGYKNYGEYFEEGVRWEYKGNLMVDRSRFVVNSGVDGADSASINTNFDKWVKEFDPEIISIMIGGNEKGTPAEFEANLKSIINKSKALNALVMLQTPVLQKNDISKYVDVILKVAKELDVPVVDHYNTWKELEKYNPHIKETFLNTDYELNHRGHLKVAQDMMKALGMYNSNNISSGKLLDMKYEKSDETTKFKTQLSTLINNSKKSIEDNKENTYSEALKSALSEDINAAEREVAQANLSIEAIMNTLNYLNDSLKSFEKTIEEKEVVDTSKLKTLVDEMSKLKQENYTKESWTNFSKALNDAKSILGKSGATKAEVDKAHRDLSKAHSELALKPSKENLQNVINEYKKLDSTKYTKESWQASQDILESANKVLENEDATKEQIEKAEKDMQAAIDSLKAIEESTTVIDDKTEDKTEVKPSKEKLENLIKSYEGIDSIKYSKESLEALNIAFESAKKVFEDQNATKEQIEAAEKEMQAAIDNLKAIEESTTVVDDKTEDKTESKPSKEKLEVLIKSYEGIDSIKYSKESLEALNIAFESAKKIFEDENATKEQIEAAEIEIQNALNNLAPVEVDTPISSEDSENNKDTTVSDDTTKATDTNDNKENVNENTTTIIANNDNVSKDNKDNSSKGSDNNISSKDANLENGSKLPNTGGVSAVSTGLSGTILTLIGLYFSKKKNKNK